MSLVCTCVSAKDVCTQLCVLKCVLACSICIYRGTEICTETIWKSKHPRDLQLWLTNPRQGVMVIIFFFLKFLTLIHLIKKREKQVAVHSTASHHDLSVFPQLHKCWCRADARSFTFFFLFCFFSSFIYSRASHMKQASNNTVVIQVFTIQLLHTFSEHERLEESTLLGPQK